MQQSSSSSLCRGFGHGASCFFALAILFVVMGFFRVGEDAQYELGYRIAFGDLGIWWLCLGMMIAFALLAISFYRLADSEGEAIWPFIIAYLAVSLVACGTVIWCKLSYAPSPIYLPIPGGGSRLHHSHLSSWSTLLEPVWLFLVPLCPLLICSTYFRRN